jgi:hypothetical protein
MLQWAWVTSILKCVVCYRWRFLWLDVFSRFFSPSLFDILITFEKFRYLICSYFIAICLHWRIFHLLGHESLHLVPFSLPLLGALFYWWLVNFHQSKAKLKFLKNTFQWCIIQFERCNVTHYQWQSTIFFFFWFSIIRYYLFQCQN